MSLPQKCDTGDRLSSSPEISRHLSREVGRAQIARSSEIMPDGPHSTRLSFLEDFTLEHSLNEVRIKTVEIAGIF